MNDSTSEKAEDIVDAVSFVGYKFINWLLVHYGFDVAMLIKNLIILGSGMIAGSILTFVGVVLLRNSISLDKNIEGVSVMHVKGKGKKWVYVHQPESVPKAIESLVGILFYYATFKRIPIILTDNKRRAVFTWLTMIILATVMIFGIGLAIRVVK